MRWITKYRPWEPPYYVARYKNHKITISEQHEGFSRKVIGYYFLIKNIKTDVSFNSLWERSIWTTKEIAQSEAVKWIDKRLYEDALNSLLRGGPQT